MERVGNDIFNRFFQCLVIRLIKILKNFAKITAFYFPVGMILGVTSFPSYLYSQTISQKPWEDFQSGVFTGQLHNKLVSSADFYEYARIRDDEFSETLEEIWHDYSISPGLSEEPGRSHINHPVYGNSNLEMSTPVNLPYTGVAEFPDLRFGQSKSFPRIRKPESDIYNALWGSFLFYGQPITVRYDKLLTLSTTASVSVDSVSGFWRSFSQSNSNRLVDQLMDYRDRMGLGDWGYFQLVKACSNHICKNIQWNSDQLTWALMIRSGFDVRLAFSQRSTTVLFPSETLIFEKQFIMIGTKRFYLDREMKSQILVTSPNPFPDTNGIIDLRFYKSLNFTGKLKSQTFIFEWNKKRYEFAFRINPEAVRFYSDYPKTDPAVYFGAPVSTTFKEDLLRQLYPLLSGFNKAEAATFLQQFVQYQFDYCFIPNKDGMAARFAEELIAARSGDDRGKSVLFSWMIRILLRLPVIGVQFPGYYSTAICFDESMDGDSYTWKQNKYIIADPTFQNTPLGIMIPEFIGLIPRLIDFPNSGSFRNNDSGIWDLAYKMGARRGGASQNTIFNTQGEALITGYFSGKRFSTPFVASFSAAKTLQWIRKFEGEVNAISFALTKVNDDEIFIAGIFSGKLEMDGQTIEVSPQNKSLFLAQFNQSGELIWMKPVPADSSKRDQSLVYLVKSDRPGNNISMQWINEDARNIRTGFSGESETGLILMGSGDFNSLYTSGSASDISGEANRSYTSLKGITYHPKVAGISAVLKMVQKPGSEINGSQIQKFIRKNTPSFEAEFPVLFSSFGRIATLKNENGIITLGTTDYKSLIFGNLKVENGARFLSTVCENGDTSISCISGFENIRNPVNLPVNSLIIDSSSGNLILDYDHDHTLKTVSL